MLGFPLLFHRPVLFGELFTGALAHYGFFDRYDSNQTVCRVRRDSDNAETDITSSQMGAWLENWVGANDGFIRTMYDLTGNGHDIGQATASLQPQIVNSGALLIENGVPTMDLGPITEDRQLTGSGLPSTNYDLSVFILFRSDTATNSVTSGPANIFNIGGNHANQRYYVGYGTSYTSNQMGARFGDTATWNLTTNAPTTLGVLSTIATRSSAGVWLNDSSLLSVSPTIGAGAANSRALELGGDGSGQGSLDGRISEWVIFDGDQSSSRAAIVDELQRLNNLS